MAHFYGTIKGQRGAASRLGSKTSGLRVDAASWQGRISVFLYEKDGIDMALVRFEMHHGKGTDRKIIYEGPVCGDGVPTLVDRSQCAVNPCTCHDDSAWTATNKRRGSYASGCSCGCKWSEAR